MRVLFCELRKLFSSGFFIFIVSAAMILNLYLCFSAKPVEVMDEHYRAFYNELDGLSNDEKIAAVNAKTDELYNGDFSFEAINQRDFLRGESEQAELIANYKNYLAEVDASAERMKIRDELNAEDGFNRAYKQQRYISTLDSNNKSMFYQTGWRRLFGANGYAEDMRLTLFAALGICFAMSPLIAYDNRRRLGYLLYTNLHGRREYFRHNTAVSAITSALISVVVNAPHITGILSLYKIEGMEFSIRCIPEFERFFDIPIVAYIVLLCVLRTVSLILCGWIILFFSAKCKNVSAALLISTAIFALPVMLYLAGAEFVLPICMPFSANREIIDAAWWYIAIEFGFCIVTGVYINLKHPSF